MTSLLFWNTSTLDTGTNKSIYGKNSLDVEWAVVLNEALDNIVLIILQKLLWQRIIEITNSSTDNWSKYVYNTDPGYATTPAKLLP